MTNQRKSIYCTVTNDLNQDQRMHRICSSLSSWGHDVTLVGRSKAKSHPLLNFNFKQKRLNCYSQKGFLFYAEYNIRLFFYLLFSPADIIYSVDSDTLMAGGLVRMIKGQSQIYDAHEYFTEVPELYQRTFVQKFWISLENIFVPRADAFITVNESLANLFSSRFQKKFHCIYNVPLYKNNPPQNPSKPPFIVYQGMLNAGRGLETMIEAMPMIKNMHLNIIGEGDLSEELRSQAKSGPARDRIHFLGWLTPAQISDFTLKATVGVNLLQADSKSYYYSLANKFFDYMHAEVPSVNMNFPEYELIHQRFKTGILISELNPEIIANAINSMTTDEDHYLSMKTACNQAKNWYNWQTEEKKLKAIFDIL